MILLYHKVHPEPRTEWWVHVEAFYQHLLALRGRKVVYLDDYDPADPEQVVITFDGIYRNVLEFAAPLLQDFGYPFELFITSDYLGKDNAFDTIEPLAEFTDKAELAAMVAMGGRLQWHSRTHLNLKDVRDRNVIRHELEIPTELRRLDSNGFNWFGYPHGEFNEVVLEETKARFMGALSCIQGDGSDRYQLNRLIVTSETRLPAKGRVAVIIPSYNYGRYLPEAIESVLRQTQPPDEILIMDDCSSDETEAIGSSYAKWHPGRIRFHRNARNLGIVNNFNTAVGMTTADYICFLGADNRFRSDYIERTAEVLARRPEVAIVYTDFALFGARARLVFADMPEARRGRVIHDHYYEVCFPNFDEASKQALETSNFIHGSSMYRRSAFDPVGGYVFREEGPEDHNLFLRIVRAGWEAERVTQPLLEYRQHSQEQENIRTATAMEVHYYKKRAQELQQQVSERDEALIAAHAQLADLQQEVGRLTHTLDSVYTSTSWRLTGPLRAVITTLRRR